MDRDRARALAEDWSAGHAEGEVPAPDAVQGVARALAERVPDPEAAAAVPGGDGRPLVVALAGRALWQVWTVGAAAGTPDAVRCRRTPLEPATTSVEVSERLGAESPLRHWWFSVGEEPLLLRTAGDDDAERFARALAAALGWPDTS